MRASRIQNTLIILLALLALTACKKNRFRIDLELPAATNTSYSLVYYASNSKTGSIMEYALAVTSGKAKLMCPMYNPTFIFLGEGTYSGNGIVIYAERDDLIKITGKSTDPLTWTVEGNKLNKEWSVWRNENATVLRSRDYERINAAVAKYVKANKDNDLAPVLLLTSYSRRVDPDGFETLWRSIPDKVRESRVVMALQRSDLLDGLTPKVPVTSISLPSLSDSVETLKIAGRTATLLYFWRSDDQGRKEVFDSLTALRRQFSDTILGLADVSFHPDTISWHRTLRRDSVPKDKWMHLWAPASGMNRNIKDLAIHSTPAFVVLDKKGERKYSGQDPEKAFQTLRKTLRK